MPRIYLPLRDREKARLRKRAQRALPLLGRCHIKGCRRKATERHHYATWPGCQDMFIPVCRKCHRKIEKEKSLAASPVNVLGAVEGAADTGLQSPPLSALPSADSRAAEVP